LIRHFLFPALAAFGWPLAAAEPAAPDYARAESWAARPGAEGDAAAVPAGAMPAARRPRVDIFYIHPSTFKSDDWNAGLAEERRAGGPNAALMARQAGAFNGCCRVFAPWYRQASLRAFAERRSRGEAAYDLAYRDVLRAFDHYMAQDNRGRPFLLVGHSQGAAHLLRLLRERIDARPAARQMVAAYVIGVGVSEGDFGTSFRTLRPCRTPLQTGCVIGWASFVEGSDTALYVARNELKFTNTHAAGDKTLLCVNPLTFDAAHPAAAAAANPGTLPGGPGLAPPLVARAIGARCAGGVLRVTPPAAALDLEPIPGGGNMHYHDIALFYAAIRANAVARSAAFLARERNR